MSMNKRAYSVRVARRRGMGVLGRVISVKVIIGRVGGGGKRGREVVSGKWLVLGVLSVWEG
jgi:hypothetical protein